MSSDNMNGGLRPVNIMYPFLQTNQIYPIDSIMSTPVTSMLKINPLLNNIYLKYEELCQKYKVLKRRCKNIDEKEEELKKKEDELKKKEEELKKKEDELKEREKKLSS